MSIKYDNHDIIAIYKNGNEINKIIKNSLLVYENSFTYDGLLPTVFNTNKIRTCKEYQIRGNISRSKNLFNINASHVKEQTYYYKYTFSGLNPNNDYTCSVDLGDPFLINGFLFVGTSFNSALNTVLNNPKTCKPNSKGELYVWVNMQQRSYCPDLYSLVIEGTRYIQLEEGSTATEYEPYTPVAYVGNEGVISKNLFNINSDHSADAQYYYKYTFSGLNPNNDYTCSSDFGGIVQGGSLFIGSSSFSSSLEVKETPQTCKPNSNGELYVWVSYSTKSGRMDLYNRVRYGEAYIQLEEGSTATSYVPYKEGYIIPINVGTNTYKVGLDVQLDTSDYIRRNSDGTGLLHKSGVDTSIILPEIQSIIGSNTLGVSTTVQPSNVHFKFK